MTGRSVRTGSGAGLTFADSLRLGQGATGEVYRHPGDAALCVKLYFPKDAAANEAKVAAMLARPPDGWLGGAGRPQLSWPLEAVHDRNGFAGFVMPRVDFSETRSLTKVLDLAEADQEPRPRLVAAALNIASLVANIARAGHHVIDFNPANFRVERATGLVTLIDCDGFQIRAPDGRTFNAAAAWLDHLAPTFVRPDGTPDLDGANAEGDLQDSWGCSVLAFRLLNRNILPFDGLPRPGQANAVPASNAMRARECARLYPYGRSRAQALQPLPSSLHDTFSASLRAAFDATFRDSRPPSPAEWRTLLTSLHPGLSSATYPPPIVTPSPAKPVCAAAGPPAAGASTGSIPNNPPAVAPPLQSASIVPFVVPLTPVRRKLSRPKKPPASGAKWAAGLGASNHRPAAANPVPSPPKKPSHALLGWAVLVLAALGAAISGRPHQPSAGLPATVATVQTPLPRTAVWSKADPNPRRLQMAGLDVVLQDAGAEVDNLVVTVREPSGASAGVARLPAAAGAFLAVGDFDGSAARPQLLVSAFTGGDRCCNVLKLLERRRSRWRVVNIGEWTGPSLDALPVDVDGDGHLDIVLRDDRFLNQFGAANQVREPPVVINVIAGRRADVSSSQRYRQVFETDFEAAKVDCLQHVNAACAVLAADGARLGEFPEALQLLVSAYNRSTAGPFPTKCGAVAPREICSADLGQAPPDFPTAVVWFLEDTGYLPTSNEAGNVAPRGRTVDEAIPTLPDPMAAPAEIRARDFVLEYLSALCSDGSPSPVDPAARLAPYVAIQGQTLSRGAAAAQQAAFAANWPIRTYLPDAASTTAVCTPQLLCTVRVSLRLDVSNPLTADRSQGVGVYTFLVGSLGILAQNGRIVLKPEPYRPYTSPVSAAEP